VFRPVAHKLCLSSVTGRMSSQAQNLNFVVYREVQYYVLPGISVGLDTGVRGGGRGVIAVSASVTQFLV
jgi:hypothetical protein